VYYKIVVFCCAFLWAKGLYAKDIHEEMLHVYGGKPLLHKACHNWVEKFSQGRSKVTDDAQPGAEVAETTVKRLLCCGFSWESNETSVSMLMEDMSRNKCFFQVRISLVLCFISLCDLFTDYPHKSSKKVPKISFTYHSELKCHKKY
jgi:hypothetical protein